IVSEFVRLFEKYYQATPRIWNQLPEEAPIPLNDVKGGTFGLRQLGGSFWCDLEWPDDSRYDRNLFLTAPDSAPLLKMQKLLQGICDSKICLPQFPSLRFKILVANKPPSTGCRYACQVERS